MNNKSNDFATYNTKTRMNRAEYCSLSLSVCVIIYKLELSVLKQMRSN